MMEKNERAQSKPQINHYENYLEKKEGNIFSSWKKNYYICLEGKALIYTQNKESKLVLGHIPIVNFTNPESSDSRIFHFQSEDKTYTFKASNEQEKEKWMKLLANINMEKEQTDFKERSSSMISEELKINKRKSALVNQGANDKVVMNEKVCTITKRISRIIKKYGYIINEEDSLSDEILKDKGITKLINIKDQKIKVRMHHGFLYKKHKMHDYFQKRWFFIFSSRPLFDKEYIQDDFDLEPKKQKEWIRFDTLYYFKSQNKREFKESLGGLEMVNSHKILHFENNEKYYLNLDVGDRIYDFYCDNRFDRDEWFEVLKNSRRTAKEYFASKTKKPRNIELLNLYFQKGEKEFTKKMENEKKIIVGNYDEIMGYDVFEFNQNELKELILSTIDGCLSNIPAKKDLLKGYAEYMTKEYLDMTKSFWERLYDKIEHAGILKLSMLLLTFRDSLLELNVNDENLYKNGKELIKIYFKKTYQNILSVIESILKSERETKGIKAENGELQTHGPADLFEILSQTFDLVKENKNKTVYKEILLLFKESIKQYLIGIDSVLTNLNIIMENEYLIAVANNSFNLIRLLNDLIDDIKNMEVLTYEEINEDIQNKKLMYTINKVSQNAISIFVSQFRLELGKEFKNNYIDLNMEKVLLKTNDIFGIFKPLMNVLVIKKCWNEILKMTLYHYISCLLMTANKKQKTVEELKQKIKFDSGILTETYEPVVGPNLTKSTLKIMDDIHDFLDISSYMISSSCLTLRQYIGNSFSISTAKALIKLRTDFTEEERDDAIEQCKEILENYNEPDNTEMGGYFQYMEKELKKQEREEKRQEMLLKLNQNQNSHESVSRHSIMYSKTFINFNNQKKEDSDSEMKEEEEEKEDEPILKMDLDDFLNEDSDEEEKNEEKLDEVKVDVSESVVFKEVSDIEYEGYMSKKSHSKWQKRYFQLKNANLYWFLDKKSSIIQNKISIKDTERVVSHKDKKFLMIVKEQEDEKGKKIKAKEYKFMCETEEEKIGWVMAITNSMKKVNNAKILKNEEKLDIKVRKKVIHDLFKLPDINTENTYMRKKVLDAINNENYFKPSPRKIEADKKKALKEEEERKKREKLEMERKKKEEKEERERKKKEERERQLKEEMEKDKQIEKDIKEGKSVGVKNRIKFWFKGLGKGNEKNDNSKCNNPIKQENNNPNTYNNDKKGNNISNNNDECVNKFNLDDFMNASDESEEEDKKEDNKENNEEKDENKDKKDNLNEIDKNVEIKNEIKKGNYINEDNKLGEKNKINDGEKKSSILEDKKEEKQKRENEDIKEENKENKSPKKTNEKKEEIKKENEIIEIKNPDLDKNEKKEIKNNSDKIIDDNDNKKIDTLKIEKEEQKKEKSSSDEEVDIKDMNNMFADCGSLIS